MKVVAAFEIVGGLYGLWLVFQDLIKLPLSTSIVILATIVIAIYIFALVAGIALWRGRKFGITASIIVQAIQLLKFMSNGVTFTFSFGADFYLMLVRGSDVLKSSVGLNGRFCGTCYDLYFNQSSDTFGVGFSLVAFIFLILLLRHKQTTTTTIITTTTD